MTDPYIVNIPQRLTRSDGTLTDEARAWFVYDNRWKHDVFQDLFGESSSFESFEDEISANENQIYKLQSAVASLNRGPAYYSISSDRTTAGDEFIRCSAACTVTLNTTPMDGELVSIQPTSDVTVTVSGTVNGSSSTYIHKAYDLANFRYRVDAGEWVIE